MKNPSIWLPGVLCLMLFAEYANAYILSEAPTLQQLAAEADVIFKGEAIASETVKDESFSVTQGYGVKETRFRVISVLKGQPRDEEVRFRHQEEVGDGDLFKMNHPPQTYRFAPGDCYIVFARKADDRTHQTRSHQTGKADAGALRCIDHRTVNGPDLSAIFWAELMALRDSPKPQDVVYAIRQFADLSGIPGRSQTRDFSSLDVLAALHRLMFRPEPEIAQAVIDLVGSSSPYLADHLASFWLGTVGVPNPGLGQMDPEERNAGATLAWRELAAVANSQAAVETRVLAIRALGRVKVREIRQMMDHWLKAPESSIRAAAVLLYTDYAPRHAYTVEQYATFAKDSSAEVRKCTAYSIGFMQNSDIISVLLRLTKDEDEAVRNAALQSLHSFSPKRPEVAAALMGNLDNPESHPLTLLALAQDNPEPYLEELAQVIEKKASPPNFSGQIPAFTAWKLLFKHLQSLAPADLKSGKWDRYLDALEKVGQYSSSEPRDIYAFYLQRGLLERATKYRQVAKKGVSYDLDYYFDQVDKSPDAFKGN